jgi:hypothetical protein
MLTTFTLMIKTTVSVAKVRVLKAITVKVFIVQSGKVIKELNSFLLLIVQAIIKYILRMIEIA